jgi:hypothetical protein
MDSMRLLELMLGSAFACLLRAVAGLVVGLGVGERTPVTDSSVFGGCAFRPPNLIIRRVSGWCDRRRGLNVSGVPLNGSSAASGGFEEPNRVHTSQQLLSRPPTAHLPFLSPAWR